MKSPNTTWTARTKRICQSDRTSSRESSRGSSTRSRHSPRTTTSAGLRLQEPFSHVSQRLVFHCSKCWIFSIIIFFISNLFYNFLPWNNLVNTPFQLSSFSIRRINSGRCVWLLADQEAEGDAVEDVQPGHWRAHPQDSQWLQKGKTWLFIWLDA